jgi:hypothetical protein
VDALQTYGDKHRETYLLEGAWNEEITKGDAAIQAGLKAIAQLEFQKPVAWIDRDGYLYKKPPKDLDERHPPYTPLYTRPPQRTWIGLTDEEQQRQCAMDV